MEITVNYRLASVNQCANVCGSVTPCDGLASQLGCFCLVACFVFSINFVLHVYPVSQHFVTSHNTESPAIYREES